MVDVVQESISKVAVIGSGVMGAAVAAHCANAGVQVLLFDMPACDKTVSSDPRKRSAKAIEAKEKLKKTKPSPIMHVSCLDAITPLNLEDDLEALRDCDWVFEAIIENVTVKKDLYQKIAPYCDKAIVSSNTSTIPLHHLLDHMPEHLKGRFLITHFFNPPRYMRLLEFVGHDALALDIIPRLQDFSEKRLGKTVIMCPDSPGFIANRIGIFWLTCAVHFAIEMDITVEEADAVLGKPLFIPKTGVFGLLDMVGIDLMPHILESMTNLLSKEDRLHAFTENLSLIHRMVADGYVGRKGAGGFYRLGEHKVKEALDLKTYTYQKASRPRFHCVAQSKKDIINLFNGSEKISDYAWRVMSETLCYAVDLLGDLGGDVTPVDRAMQLGFNWKFGPFALLDKIGIARFIALLEGHGQRVPAELFKVRERFYKEEKHYTSGGVYQDNVVHPHVLLLSDIKKHTRPVLHNKSASVWDIGDGVLCLEVHSTMNTMNPLVLWMIGKAVKLANKKYKALVIYNEGEHFSAGANIGILLFALKLRLYPLVSFFVWQGQRAYRKIQKSRVPVVAAPSGLCLGGGCEIVMHCHSVEAHSETYMGLVEVGVGLVPAWGGCKEMLLRAAETQTVQRTFYIPPPQTEFIPQGPIAWLRKVFETIATARVSTSAMEAKELNFLHKTDGITMNRDHLLYNAKQRALSLVMIGKDGAVKRRSTRIRRSYVQLSGESGRVALCMAVDDLKRAGKITPYDEVVSKALAGVLTGYQKDILDKTKVKEILKSERQVFLSLCHHKETRDRIEHMLKTGKPLRN